MPLPQPAIARQLAHTREVRCVAWERDDGLYDIEGHMTDVKPGGFQRYDGWQDGSQPLHDMWLRLTIDLDLNIVDAVSAMDAFPHEGCGGAQPSMAALIGLRIGPGWMGRVNERVGGALGCTHLRELLGPMATTAFQGLYAAWQRRDGDKARPPRGSCWGYADDADRDAARARRSPEGTATVEVRRRMTG